jgi:hypothetical protein
VKECVNDEMMEKFIKRYIERLQEDLNRIAQNRIAEEDLSENLTFEVARSGPKEIAIRPSNPVLFYKLEFGEFNADGTLKTPPHSIMKEWKAIIRV